MTIALRDQAGQTRTFYQEGSRIRIANPSGTDDGEAQIVDLKTTEHVIVYDDAKAYYDYNKTLAKLREVAGEIKKTHARELKRRAPVISFRSLGEARRVNGLACAMYEQIVDGKAESQLCVAPWGGRVGAREDFVWFDAFMDRMASDIIGSPGRSAKSLIHVLARAEGLVVSMSSTNDRRQHGHAGDRQAESRSVAGRDVPRPGRLQGVLAAAERERTSAHRAAPGGRRARAPRRRPSGRMLGFVGLVIGVGLIIGLLIHAAFLHLFASIVIERRALHAGAGRRRDHRGRGGGRPADRPSAVSSRSPSARSPCSPR